MKPMQIKIALLAAVAAGLITMSGTSAQSWTKVDPKITSLLVDTSNVHAYNATLSPGQKSVSHTHPAHFFYALTDCKLKVTYSDGEVEMWDVKAGEGGYANPERPHVTENTGTAVCRFLLVELKEHPYNAMKQK